MKASKDKQKQVVIAASKAQWSDEILWWTTNKELLFFRGFYLESNLGEPVQVKYLVLTVIVYDFSLISQELRNSGKYNSTICYQT